MGGNATITTEDQTAITSWEVCTTREGLRTEGLTPITGRTEGHHNAEGQTPTTGWEDRCDVGKPIIFSLVLINT